MLSVAKSSTVTCPPPKAPGTGRFRPMAQGHQLRPAPAGAPVNYLMSPFAQGGGQAIDWLDPAAFKYCITWKPRATPQKQEELFPQPQKSAGPRACALLHSGQKRTFYRSPSLPKQGVTRREQMQNSSTVLLLNQVEKRLQMLAIVCAQPRKVVGGIYIAESRIVVRHASNFATY